MPDKIEKRGISLICFSVVSWKKFEQMTSENEIPQHEFRTCIRCEKSAFKHEHVTMVPVSYPHR